MGPGPYSGGAGAPEATVGQRSFLKAPGLGIGIYVDMRTYPDNTIIRLSKN